MFFVYILCCVDGSFYVGRTQNLCRFLFPFGRPLRSLPIYSVCSLERSPPMSRS